MTSEQRSALRVCVGEQVRIRRVRAGKTKKDLAAAVGISQVHMGRLERGEKEFMLWHLSALAVALHCRMEDFL